MTCDKMCHYITYHRITPHDISSPGMTSRHALLHDVQPVTSGRIKLAKATHFAWLNPFEEVGKTDTFKAHEDGSFVYLFSDEGNKELSSAGKVDETATAKSYPVEDYSLPKTNILNAAAKFKETLERRDSSKAALGPPVKKPKPAAAAASTSAAAEAKSDSEKNSKACIVM